jgi:hypothetical protein
LLNQQQVATRGRKGDAVMKLTVIGIGKTYSSEPLCNSCVNSHVVKGFGKGEELVYCNFGSAGPRALAFAVSECTDYFDRNARMAVAKAAAGFIKSKAEGAA